MTVEAATETQIHFPISHVYVKLDGATIRGASAFTVEVTGKIIINCVELEAVTLTKGTGELQIGHEDFGEFYTQVELVNSCRYRDDYDIPRINYTFKGRDTMRCRTN